MSDYDPNDEDWYDPDDENTDDFDDESDLFECPNCGKDVHELSVQCPHCSEYLPNNAWMSAGKTQPTSWIVWLLVFALLMPFIWLIVRTVF